MTDKELRTALLRQLYDERRAKDWLTVGGQGVAPSPEEREQARIAQQLADVGLLQLKMLPGGMCGQARITATGVDVIEGASPSPIALTINVTNSSGVQIGQGNTQQSFIDGLHVMLAGIDGLPGTAEEKAEAKDLLRKFLEHRLVKNISTVLVEIVSSQAKTDIELVDLLWERSAHEKPGDWQRRLSLLKNSIDELDARLDKVPPAELFAVASQLRERYRQYLESARDAFASSSRYQDIKKEVIAGLKRIERLSHGTPTDMSDK